ncbi:NUDIX hydrolase [Mariniluteicoccus flavus]
MSLPAGERPGEAPGDLMGRCRDELAAWSAPNDLQAGLREAFLTHADAHPDGWSRDCPGAHLTASSMIIAPAGDRVLLVLHRRLGRWLQTGGHLEAGDHDLLHGALREAREESGLSALRPLPGIAQLDRHEVPCGLVRPTFHLDVRYVLLADPGERPTVSDESEDVRWFSVDALPEVDDSVTTLVRAARQRLRS